MTISGFTMVRNATLFHYPIKESIESILPLVDEFIIALDKGDATDTTDELIKSIQSPKIKIIYRTWDETLYKNSEVFRFETNFALSQCTGDWCFYLQADEVIHEDDLPIIKNACEKYIDNKKIEGLLFNYLHFWGDYNHYLPFHGWYRNEIRIIRNNCNIESIKDAQSFRKKSGEKLKVAKIHARVFHYGWVRPPETMIKKKNEHDNIHRGKTQKQDMNQMEYFNYGDMSKIPLYKGSHPKIMENKMKELYWNDKLSFTKIALNRKPSKHEITKKRIISYFENKVLGGKQLFGYKNWKIVAYSEASELPLTF